MTFAVISEVPGYSRQAMFRGKEEALRHPTPALEPQSGMISKPKFGSSGEDISKTEPTMEDVPFSSGQKLRLGFNRPPRPWLPPRLRQKLDRVRRIQPKRREMVELIEEIAKISADFYQVKPGEFIAMEFDGRIVDSSDTQIDLLMRIQGKKFDTPVIVWEVGSETFSGWRT